VVFVEQKHILHCALRDSILPFPSGFTEPTKKSKFERIKYFLKEKEKPEKRKRKRKSDGLTAKIKCKTVPLVWHFKRTAEN